MENECMKQLFLFPLLLVLFISPSILKAQKGKPIFGGNVIAGMPTGELRNGYKSVFGIEGMGGIAVVKNLYVMGTIGFQSYAPDPNAVFPYAGYDRITMIPLKAGLRLYPVNKVFLTGNLGVGLVDDGELVARESRFVYDVGAGLHYSMFQASIHYDAIKRVNSTGTSNAFLIKLGIAIR